MNAGTSNVKSNPGGSGILNLSLLSLSPDNSSEAGSTPKTPECANRIDLDFGAVGMGMTPTPPSSVEGPGIFNSDACQDMRSNTFPVASTIGLDFRDHLQSASGIWSSPNVGQGASHVSHIWTNRQATPPHIAPQAGSIVDHDHPHILPVGFLSPQRHNFQSPSDEKRLASTQHLQTSFMMNKASRIRDQAGQLPLACGLELLNAPSSRDKTTKAQGQNSSGFASIRSLPQARQPFGNDEQTLDPVMDPGFYHHQHSSSHYLPPNTHSDRYGQPLKDPFLHLQEIQTVQDLGVDILRISPQSANHYPIRQLMISPDGYPHSPLALSHRHTLPITSFSFLEDPIRQPNPPPPPPLLPLASLAGTHALHIISNSNSNSNNTGFTPMHAVNEQTRAAFRPHDDSSQRQMSNRFSTRYHGMHTEANASAEYLAPEQNCALWLTNLPADVTPKQLLGAIRKVGRIWCSFINYPDYVSHHTAAAKVVFFSPRATQQFLSDSWTKGLYMGPNRVRVAHNRIKSESKEEELSTPKSRVLIITGRSEFVNETYLTKYFKDRFIFQNDEVIELINAGGRAVLEWKFGSYRCQAQMGKMSLEKDRPFWLEKVEFGEDPCEVGDTFSSYGIAAERIQGKGL